MPLIRKIVQVGNAKAVIIPKDWLRYLEKELKEPIREVGMEVDGKLIIEPIIPKKIKWKRGD